MTAMIAILLAVKTDEDGSKLILQECCVEGDVKCCADFRREEEFRAICE